MAMAMGIGVESITAGVHSLETDALVSDLASIVDAWLAAT